LKISSLRRSRCGRPQGVSASLFSRNPSPTDAQAAYGDQRRERCVTVLTRLEGLATQVFDGRWKGWQLWARLRL
jgi:hypothetical protein